MKRELTNQELLDRYIHSLKLLRPPDKTEDIAAEIKSNLQSLAEDKATQLGRELSLAEMSSILKQHGHPMVVAGRYRDQPTRGLISPELFPFYWFTLRAVFAVWVAIRMIVAVFVFQGTTPAGSILLYFGRDVLLESDADVLQRLTLEIGECRMVVAAPSDHPLNSNGMLRVATKYPRVAARHFGSRGLPVEIIQLSGSVEVAPTRLWTDPLSATGAQVPRRCEGGGGGAPTPTSAH